jgi:hypothetical protein
MPTLDETKDEIGKLVISHRSELHALEDAYRALGGDPSKLNGSVNGNGSKPAAKPARKSAKRTRKSGVAKSAAAKTKAPRAKRGEREEQLIAAITSDPGQKVAFYAERVGVTAQQLYPILGRLGGENKVVNNGDGTWSPKGDWSHSAEDKAGEPSELPAGPSALPECEECGAHAGNEPGSLHEFSCSAYKPPVGEGGEEE